MSALDGFAEEESLGTGIERQVARFEGLKDAVGEITANLSRLKPQYDALRRQCQSLEDDKTSRQLELEELNAEINKLAEERDTLRVDFNDAQAQNAWWMQNDLSNASSSGSASGGVVDDRGKLNRKVWLLEERNKQLCQEVSDLKKVHADEMESEYAIAAGLRDRIGKLEERTKRQKEEGDSAKMKEERLRKELEDLTSLKNGEEMRKETDLKDLKESLSREKEAREDLERQLESMKQERDAAREEVKKVAETVPQTVKSPSRALQTLSPNVNLGRSTFSPLPATPSRKVKPFTALLDSPSSPTVSLAMKYAYLEDRHQTLKNEYDKLRERYSDDIKHLKEWKAVEKARIEVKKIKREEKKARRASRSASTSVSISTPVPASGASTSQGLPENAILVEESESLKAVNIDRQEQEQERRQSQRRTSVTLADDEEEYVTHAEVEVDEPQSEPKLFYEVARQLAESSLTQPHFTPRPRQTRTHSQVVSPPRTSQAVARATAATSTLSHAAVGTAETSVEKRVVSATTQTPWLGRSPEKHSTNAKISSSRKLQVSRSRSHVDDNDFNPPPNAEDGTFLPNSSNVSRTPLIRDRGGNTNSITVESGRPSSLRRKALANALATPAITSTPTRKDEYETPTRSQRSASASGSKRKLTDMEGLTPAEKSAQLKKLAKLPASEKRELYKGYKGKGRYLPPEEVQSKVTDEYEIDPEQNEGASYAFHDVKRKKAERKGMHGGDCECCKDYYEAVGEIPRFNQPPAWRDVSPPVSSTSQGVGIGGESINTSAGVKAHQDKVSRHRETWNKPPTPPGYWKIGFPNTQDVVEQNEKADMMLAEKEARTRKEAMQKDSKWRKKQ